MNLKTYVVIVILALFGILSSCKKEEETITAPEPTVVVYTDNTTYIDADNIVLTLKNGIADTIKYGACAFSNDLDLSIEKKTDTAWTTVSATLCIDYYWANLAGNSQVSDTINANILDQGDYRIKMKLIIGSNNTVLYSGEFNKK